MHDVFYGAIHGEHDDEESITSAVTATTTTAVAAGDDAGDGDATHQGKESALEERLKTLRSLRREIEESIAQLDRELEGEKGDGDGEKRPGEARTNSGRDSDDVVTRKVKLNTNNGKVQTSKKKPVNRKRKLFRIQ